MARRTWLSKRSPSVTTSDTPLMILMMRSEPISAHCAARHLRRRQLRARKQYQGMVLQLQKVFARTLRRRRSSRCCQDPRRRSHRVPQLGSAQGSAHIRHIRNRGSRIPVRDRGPCSRICRRPPRTAGPVHRNCWTRSTKPNKRSSAGPERPPTGALATAAPPAAIGAVHPLQRREEGRRARRAAGSWILGRSP